MLRLLLHLRVPETINECKDGSVELLCLDRSHYDNDDDDDSEDDSDDEYEEEDPTGIINLVICDNMLNSRDDDENQLERNNQFMNNLVGTKALASFTDELQHLKSTEVTYSFLCLDDWEVSLRALQQCGPIIEKLDFSHSDFTEQGALALGNILKSSSPNNKNDKTNGTLYIKQLALNGMRGSTAWIDGLIQNKTITHLYVHTMPILQSAIQFIQKMPQLKVAKLSGSICDEGTQQQRVGADEMEAPESLQLKRFRIIFHREEKFSVRLCQSIGKLLRRANNLMYLDLRHVKPGIPYDFIRDAIHCRKFYLLWSDFDPRAISSFVPRDDSSTGKLEKLFISHPKDMSKVTRLLENIDLTRLDSFEYLCEGSNLEDDGSSMDAVYDQLANNKGPRHLLISIDDMDLDQFATRLASSIVGNNKIEKLEIVAQGIGHDLEPQRILVEAMNQATQLQSWGVYVNEPLNEESIAKWNKWIINQVQSNWSIQKIVPPKFQLGDDIKEMLSLNKQWKEILCSHDKLSSGIWSPSLSRIKTVSSMFRILREVPNVFQEMADTASGREEYQLPSFVVPHHPDCPACHKRTRTQ